MNILLEYSSLGAPGKTSSILINLNSLVVLECGEHLGHIEDHNLMYTFSSLTSVTITGIYSPRLTVKLSSRGEGSVTECSSPSDEEGDMLSSKDLHK